MIINTLGGRLREVLEEKKISNYKIATDLDISKTTIANYLDDKVKRYNGSTLDRISQYLNINKDWLLNGNSPKYPNESTFEIKVSEPFELEYSENNNANAFMKLENGQYLMTMPLAEFDVQAGLLDHYQDLDYMREIAKHSIIVDEPVRGRYVAFRVKGDSMDDGSGNSIHPNSIVSTRELQRQHWSNKIRFKDFPYWVIYTTESRMPLLKEIIEHDTAKGIIKCHSLNNDPGYRDFELSLNDVQALFYVIDISRQVSKRMIY